MLGTEPTRGPSAEAETAAAGAGCAAVAPASEASREPRSVRSDCMVDPVFSWRHMNRNGTFTVTKHPHA